MNSHRICAITLASAFVAASVSAAPSAHAASFDGDWSVLVHTANGHCGTTRWGLAIRGGYVHYAGGFAYGYPVGLSGRVSSSGQIRVNILAGPRSASGAGQLWKDQGSGRWAGQGPSGTCAGVWSATRAAWSR